MLPLVLSHELVHPFKFWHNNELREGICSGKELYCLQSQFTAQARQQAFGLATDLAAAGAQVCITCMRAEYKVWVSLRTLANVCPIAENSQVAA